MALSRQLRAMRRGDAFVVDSGAALRSRFICICGALYAVIQLVKQLDEEKGHLRRCRVAQRAHEIFGALSYRWSG